MTNELFTPRRPMSQAFDSPASDVAPTSALNVRIDAELHKKLKDHAYRTGRTMRSLVEEYVESL